MRIALILAAVTVATACTTPQQRAAQTIERYGPYCEGLGYKPQSDPWRDCIQREHARITQIIWSD